MSTGMLPILPPGGIADVALLLEGTYPYVPGGVSSWVHQIILGLPHVTFSLVFLGGRREDYGRMKYQLPPNVMHMEAHYLQDAWKPGRSRTRRSRPQVVEDVRLLFEYFTNPNSRSTEGLAARIVSAVGSDLAHEEFLYSEDSFELICDSYTKFCTDPSFVDYFWTLRTMLAPLFNLARIVRRMPPATVYHSVSTGYAGFMGVLAHQVYGKNFILTEHGIYTKERKIDLARAKWIKDAREAFGGGLEDDVSYIRRLWIHFFEAIGRLAYEAADPIIALYEGSRKRQIEAGADPGRTRVVANGVDVARLSALRAERPEKTPMILGLVGRVVPIKDIKTFIRMMRSVCNKIPEAEGWIVGPDQEDQDYVKECHDLVANLGLETRVKFLGFQRPQDVLPKMGLLVLTSISEALPLVLLEGYAAGLPVLATDVGSCRDLVYGASEEDRALGPSGSIVPIADPEAAATEAVGLLTDGDRWGKAQASAIARVERYYTFKIMIDAYRDVYEEALG